ncbi:MAG: aldo/keto reductase [Kiritimatiellae bacterium]|nr:aldo/keto reductase [Kiritimatiellia bacterium]MDD4735896.1 aldo/keto reductase [Kiritimatiellia bacterium]
MKYVMIPQTDLSVSRLAYGCMRLCGSWNREPITDAERSTAERAIEAALEAGINFFDHADIYCLGKSEIAFSSIWREHPSLRSKIVLQSKCGIRFADDPAPGDPKRYDFSYKHLVGSVEGILQRLGTDYLDILMLHRPDPLMESEEVARAFDELHRSGKVRWFGVSNFSAMQIQLLSHWVDQPIVISQNELSLGHAHLIHEGVLVNQIEGDGARASGLLDYCRLRGIFLQAWSPLGGGRFFQASRTERDARIIDAVELIARNRSVSPEAIMLAWIMRHPAGIQPVIGTGHPDRIRACAQADELELSREEWYELFTVARGDRMP